MDISVVVPFHNEEDHLEGCISALRGLEYPEARREIVLVDNNSTDRSVEIVRRHPDIQLLAEPRPGDFAARNRGIAASSGEIIAFTDSDTAPRPDWLERITEAMSDPTVEVVVGALQFGRGRGVMSWLADYEAEKNRFIFSGNVPEIYYGYTCNMAVRRRVFEDLGQFPEVYRNSDAVLVRKAVDRYSCAAVIYGADVVVQRLEVADFGSYLCKQHTYGRDLGRYGGVANARPLNTTERLEVFRRTSRGGRFGLIGSAGLLFVLAAGAAAYDFGRVRGVPSGR